MKGYSKDEGVFNHQFKRNYISFEFSYLGKRNGSIS